MKTALLTLLLAFILGSCSIKKQFAIPNASDKIIQDTMVISVEYTMLKVYTISTGAQRYVPMFPDTVKAKNTVRFGRLGTIQLENKDGDYKTFYSYGDKIVGTDPAIGDFITITAKTESGAMVRIVLTDYALLVEYPWLRRAYLYF